MGATPTFLPDLPMLKARLRLSSVDTGDAAALIDSVVEEVRVGLFHELGSSLVAELQAVTISDTPVTDDELRALRAQSVEILWCRMLLMRRMPVLFLPALGQARDAWNDEGIAREASSSQIRKEAAKLQEEINISLSILRGDTDAGETVRAATIGPETTPPTPGESILPAYLRGAEL